MHHTQPNTPVQFSVRLIFSSLILSFCSVSCYFVWAYRIYTRCARGFQTLLFLIVACLVLRVVFVCVSLIVVVAVVAVVVVVNATVVVIVVIIILIVATAIIIVVAVAIVTVSFDVDSPSKWNAYEKESNAPNALTQDPTRYTHFTLSVDSLSYRGLDFLPARSIFMDDGKLLLVAINCCKNVWIKERYFQCDTTIISTACSRYKATGIDNGNTQSNKMGERNCNLRFSFWPQNYPK